MTLTFDQLELAAKAYDAQLEYATITVEQT